MNFPDFRRGGDIEVLERNLSERSLEETGKERRHQPPKLMPLGVSSSPIKY